MIREGTITKTEGERLAVLEYQVSQLIIQNTELNKSVKDLLELRTKGMGAFWLASSLLGTGIIGTLFLVINYFKG